MVPPPAKKQKIDNPRSPIIFQFPGLKLDVSLKVFEVEFHVHSMLLKLHSAFFRKFLDSPDKFASKWTAVGGNSVRETVSASTSMLPEVPITRPSLIFGDFKCKWVTNVDEGQEEKWQLVAVNPVPGVGSAFYITPTPTPPEVSATRSSMVFGAFKYKWVTKVDEGEETK
jgi:hypothetical protein